MLHENAQRLLRIWNRTAAQSNHDGVYRYASELSQQTENLSGIFFFVPCHIISLSPV